MRRRAPYLEYTPAPKMPATTRLAAAVGFDVAIAAAVPTAERPELRDLFMLGPCVTTGLVMAA